MNILCGKDQSTKELDYMGPGMKTERMELAIFVEKIFWDIFERLEKNPLIIMMPELFKYQITEVDKRFFINCESLRQFLKNMIIERKQKGLTEENAIDMISILTLDETYGKQIDDMVDDVLVMFIAGSKTIQVTTTNFITHMLHRPDLREKLDAELNPMLEKC